MEQIFNELLLRTAFACMACDGDIAPEEVDLIKELDQKDHLFGDIKIENRLEELTAEINELGKGFLKDYLNAIKEADLNEDGSLRVLDVAVKTIKADKVVKYSEIKFFKVIKANLNLDDDIILERVDGIDEMWVAQDIKDYGQLYESYFDNIELPKFDLQVLSADETEKTE